MRRALALAGALAVLALLSTARADAIPIFAQRYHLLCSACHSVLPELNAFGNAFRDHGYRLDGVPRHGTTVAAIRYQLEWDRDPAAGSRRFTPGGVLLAQAEVGAIEAFMHENLGAQGGPSALFLGYLAYRDKHSGVLYRGGLFELPLVHSPAQRNDTLLTYGYEGAKVGLNDLLLSQPRWGLEAERDVGRARVAATAAFASYGGSAYGGAPLPTGETTAMQRPEVGLFARMPLTGDLRVGVDALAGTRAIARTGARTFADDYERLGVNVAAQRGRFDLLAEQFYGRDLDADGSGGRIDSSGGYVRLRYAPTPHAFLGVRYDAAATPAATRELVWYAETHVTRHARLLLEQHRAFGGPTHLEAGLTVGFPWPLDR